YFFFSSRRRHTRSYGDWSSDVCSSDLICQMAKKRFKVNRTIARLNNPKNEHIFQRLGIDITVSPTRAILSLIEAELPGTPFVSRSEERRVGKECRFDRWVDA